MQTRLSTSPFKISPMILDGELAAIDPVRLAGDREPTTPVTEPILGLMAEVTDGSIDIAPRWQRWDIWSDKKKAALIESIFFNLPLPLFYMARAEKEVGGVGSATGK